MVAGEASPGGLGRTPVGGGDMGNGVNGTGLEVMNRQRHGRHGMALEVGLDGFEFGVFDMVQLSLSVRLSVCLFVRFVWFFVI